MSPLSHIRSTLRKFKMDDRSRHGIVSVQEQILILRSYKKNGDNWPQVYREMVQVEGGLPRKAQCLYRENSYAEIKIPDVRLTSKRELLIENEELNSLVLYGRENGQNKLRKESYSLDLKVSI